MKNHSKTRKQTRPSEPIVAENQACGKKKVNRRISKIQKTSLKKMRQINRSKKARQRMRARGLNEKTLRKVSESAFGAFLHHKQVLSIALVALGVVFTP